MRGSHSPTPCPPWAFQQAPSPQPRPPNRESTLVVSPVGRQDAEPLLLEREPSLRQGSESTPYHSHPLTHKLPVSVTRAPADLSNADRWVWPHVAQALSYML